MQNDVIEEIKEQYDINEFPELARFWIERLPNPDCSPTTVDHTVYCPHCQSMHSSAKRDAAWNIFCVDCGGRIQTVQFNGPVEDLTEQAFECPEKCNGRTIADRVAVQAHDGYYIVICNSCGSVCHEGITREQVNKRTILGILDSDSDIDKDIDTPWEVDIRDLDGEIID
jgi:transcription elongation factor Elf1